MRADGRRTLRAAGAAALVAGAGCAQAQAPACPGAGDWPAKMRLEYDVTASRGPLSISGESVLTFERTSAGYSIKVETDSAAIYHASQSSRGSIGPGGLRPSEYFEARGRRTPQTTTIDWDARTVRFSAAPEVQVPTQPGLQDRASLILQLAWQQRSSGAATYEVPVAGSRRVGPYRFSRHAVETVRLPIGAVEAVRFARDVDDDQDRIEAWLGNTWCGLPVRIRYTDRKGGVIDHRMRGARIE